MTLRNVWDWALHLRGIESQSFYSETSTEVSTLPDADRIHLSLIPAQCYNLCND